MHELRLGVIASGFFSNRLEKNPNVPEYSVDFIA